MARGQRHTPPGKLSGNFRGKTGLPVNPLRVRKYTKNCAKLFNYSGRDVHLEKSLTEMERVNNLALLVDWEAVIERRRGRKRITPVDSKVE